MPVMRPKVIGIVGSRRRILTADYMKLVRVFDDIYREGDWILSGGCKIGADAWAEMISDERSIHMMIYDADWDNLGKKAGPLRGIEIGRDCDVLIAIVSEDRTGGTEYPVKEADRLKKRIYLI